MNFLMVIMASGIARGRVRTTTTTTTESRKMAATLQVIIIIIYMKKLLDSDWLRAVQFKRNTSAKSVTPVQKV